MKYLLYVIPLILFFVLYHLATLNGVFMQDFDSLQFKHAAESWVATGVLKEADGGDFIHWPPLYPIILSFFNWNVGVGAKYFHFFCLSFSLGIWISIYSKVITDKYLLWGLVLLNASSLHLIYIGRFLWVESLFLLLLSISVQQYISWTGWKSLLIVTCTGVLLALLRTASILFWMNIFLMIAILYKNKNFYCKVSTFILPFLVWLGYRQFISERGSFGKVASWNTELFFEKLQTHTTWYLGFLRECFLPFFSYHILFELSFLLVLGWWFYIESRCRKLPREVVFMAGISFLYIIELIIVTIVKDFGNSSEVFRHLAVVSMGVYFVIGFLFQRALIRHMSNRKYLYFLVIVVITLNFIRSCHQIASWNNWL